MAVYLVTGAAGFIGSNLVEALLDKGESVISLDNFSNGRRSNLDFVKAHPNASNHTFIEGDIRSLDTCQAACQGVDYILHQAALGSVPRSIEEPILYHENNTTGTVNIFKSAQDNGVKRVVYASSSSVYGDTPTLPKVETMPPTPKSPYAVSKLNTEFYGAVFTETYGLETVGLRYFNVFGPKQDPSSQYAAAVPKFITAALHNEPITIYSDGKQTRDFTFIQNVIDANLNACSAAPDACGKTYNIGCGSRISINNLVHDICTLTKSQSKIEYQPKRLGDVRDSLADIGLARQYLKLDTFIALKEIGRAHV